MTKQFSSETVPLGELFTSPVAIEAPGYQRSFAWTAEEAGQLLDDILQAIEADADYFLSFMLFIERHRPRSLLPAWARTPPRGLEVVDGFQRLTSLTILYCILRDIDVQQELPPNLRLLTAIGASGGRSIRPRLSLGPADEAFFDAHVRAPGATLLRPQSDDLAPAEANIIGVRDHFMSVLADLDAARRLQLLDFLLDRCHVSAVVTTDIDRAHQLFTILNARGKPLQRKDILKAALLGSAPPDAVGRAAAIWQDADALLGKELEALFSHIRVMYGRSDGKVISSVMTIAAQRGGALPFIEQVLGPAATALHELRCASHTGTPHSAEISRMLGYLNRFNFSDWIPPALLWCLEKGGDAGEVAWFLRALERFSLGIRLLGLGGGKRATWYGAVVAAIRRGQDLRAPGNVFEFSRQDRRTMRHNLRDLHARDASAAKYLLMRLTDHLAGRLESASFPDDMTIEHVLPRKLSANSQWRGWFADPTDREQYTESLGNLLLVTKSQNDRAGNLPFAQKRDIYFPPSPAPCPAINLALRDLSEWKPAQIKARETDMLNLIETLWGLELGIEPGEEVKKATVAPARKRRA
jgi:hypothetical protein